MNHDVHTLRALPIGKGDGSVNAIGTGERIGFSRNGRSHRNRQDRAWPRPETSSSRKVNGCGRHW